MDLKKKPEAEEFIRAYTSGDAIRAWTFMGAHAQEQDGRQGYVFRVWAPHAQAVSVVGDFNRWEEDASPLSPIWTATTPINMPSAPGTDAPS